MQYSKLFFLSPILCLVFSMSAMEKQMALVQKETTNSSSAAHQMPLAEQVSLIADTLDELVIKGIDYINRNGERFNARAGNGLQAYDISYTLTNPRNRLHLLRQERAIQYLCRELLAYFNGSLYVKDGLEQAASAWKSLADKDGKIASNYGYYVFHQKIASANGNSQYEWVIANLLKNLDSRKAFININQPQHKIYDSKDFPCTIGLQFFVRQNHLCCVVSSRSTDIYTGLPYDMGFFSFLTELVYSDLKKQLPSEQASQLRLGYVTMKTNFTQIYDKTKKSALTLLKQSEASTKKIDALLAKMPEIDDAQLVLKDIYDRSSNSAIMKWIHENAKLNATQS